VPTRIGDGRRESLGWRRIGWTRPRQSARCLAGLGTGAANQPTSRWNQGGQGLIYKEGTGNREVDTKEGREGFSGKGLTCGQGGGSRAYQFRRQIGRLVPHLGGQAEGVMVNMQAVCHLLAHLEHKRFGSRVAVKDLLQGSVDAGKAISPLLGPLVGSGFGVKCEDAQRREQEFG